MSRNFVAASLQYLDAGNGAPLATQFGQMTLSIWYKTSTNGYMQWFGRQHLVWELQLYTNSLINLYVNGGEHHLSANGSVPRDGAWHHILVTYDKTGANNAIGYIDGVQKITINNPASIPASANALNIGRRPVAGGEYWDGDLGEAGLWNRILTGGEIADLAAGEPGSDITSGLQGFWRLLGNDSPEPDFSANNNDAVLVNGPTKGADHPIAEEIVSERYLKGEPDLEALRETYAKGAPLLSYPELFIKSDSLLDAVRGTYAKGSPLLSYPELFIKSDSFLEKYTHLYARGAPALQARAGRYIKSDAELQRLALLYLRGAVTFATFERYLKGAPQFAHSSLAFIRGQVMFVAHATYLKGSAALVTQKPLEELSDAPQAGDTGLLSRNWLSVSSVKKAIS